MTQRKRVKVANTSNTFDSIGAVGKWSNFLAEVADVCVDGPIEWRKLTTENVASQFFAIDNLPAARMSTSSRSNSTVVRLTS